MTTPINLRAHEQQSLDTSSARQWALGTRMLITGGRVFRYSKAGSVALTAGTLARTADLEDGWGNLSVAAAANAGDQSFTVTLTYQSISGGALVGGFVYGNDGTGQGQIYEIAGNTAGNKGSTITLLLVSPLETALTTSSQVTLIKDRYDGVRITNKLTMQQAIGVVPIAVPVSWYFWLQTYGAAPILQDGTLYENWPVAPSVNIRGAISTATSPLAVGAEIADAASGMSEAIVADIGGNERKVAVRTVSGLSTNNVVGYSIDPREDTEYSLVYITLLN